MLNGLLLGGALYLAYALFIFLTQRSLLFPAPKFAGSVEQSPLPADAARILMQAGGGTTQAWLLPPTANAAARVPLLVYFHGNAEVIDHWVDFFAPARAQGIAALLVEYPGYGRSGGRPSQAAIVAAAEAALDAAIERFGIDPAKVVPFGHSLGGGVALALAARRATAGIILLSTFRSVREFARHYRVPEFLARDPFDNLTALHGYPRPVLILHGRHDEVIPFDHAEALLAAAPAARLVAYDCAHNDCVARFEADLWREVIAYLKEIGVAGSG